MHSSLSSLVMMTSNIDAGWPPSQTVSVSGWCPHCNGSEAGEFTELVSCHHAPTQPRIQGWTQSVMTRICFAKYKVFDCCETTVFCKCLHPASCDCCRSVSVMVELCWSLVTILCCSSSSESVLSQSLQISITPPTSSSVAQHGGERGIWSRDWSDHGAPGNVFRAEHGCGQSPVPIQARSVSSVSG